MAAKCPSPKWVHKIGTSDCFYLSTIAPKAGGGRDDVTPEDASDKCNALHGSLSSVKGEAELVSEVVFAILVDCSVIFEKGTLFRVFSSLKWKRLGWRPFSGLALCTQKWSPRLLTNLSGPIPDDRLLWGIWVDHSKLRGGFLTALVHEGKHCYGQQSIGR